MISCIYNSRLPNIAVFNSSNVIAFSLNKVCDGAIIRPFTLTVGQGGVSFIWPYSLDVFLITSISAPNSCSARRAASMMDCQRMPIGSFM